MEDKILDLIREENPENPLQYVRDLVKDFALEKVSEQITTCSDCDICHCGKTLPHGNTNASIMFIGSMPESELENEIKPALFDGESSVILDKVIDDILMINRDELFFANAVNCWPYKQTGPDKTHRVPTKQELSNCYLFINHLIEVVQPLAIVVLGAAALNAFEPTMAITKDRGTWFNIKGIPAVATFSPDYFIKVAGKKDEELVEQQKFEFIDDINMAINYVKNNYPNIEITKE